MSGWVLDSSLAMAWGLPDETASRAENFFERITDKDELWVPALWWYEISNALVVAQRRKRVSEAESLRFIELLRGLPLETDFSSGTEVVWRYRTLAQEHALSAYDAAYLELAGRRELALASLDGPLVHAARKAGVRVLET